jgi:glycosyltransferase involved in cell wall biosynthesis
MRVGLVSKWFNRGQPVVARQLRSALEDLGHETYVLARPKKERGPMKGRLQRDGVWDQPRVDEASAYDVTADEYREWVARRGIEAILCDQNYQFAELAELRRGGVIVIGRFVWEHFTADHVAGAREAFDVVYSFTRCEQERYRGFGLETPYVPWGIHPELLAVEPAPRDDGNVQVIFPGGFVGHRKPIEPVVDAFMRTGEKRLRLLVKAQVERRDGAAAARGAAASDERIEFVLSDQPTDQHLRVFASADVCLAPSRWEGLGLPLFEATAFGLPVITNDIPPLNEVVEHGRNGLLVRSYPNGTAKSGIPAYDSDLDEMAAAIERLADDGERSRLAAGAREVRAERSWDVTVAGIGELIERAAASRRTGAAVGS